MPGPMGRGPGFNGAHMPRPSIHGPHPQMYPIRHYASRHPYLKIGISALVGSAIGATIANNVANKKNMDNTANSSNNTYDVFTYCPNCGTQRAGNNTICSKCGSSLVK